MKEKFNEFIGNRNYKLLFMACLALFGFHLYQYIDSGYRIEPLIRVIVFGLSCPLIVFTGDRFIPYLMFLFGIVLGQTISFENYTPFILVFISATMKKKFRIPMFCIYTVDAVIVCIRHSKSAVHLCIHLLSCFMIYSFLSIFTSKIEENATLNLTEDEKYILNEIVFNDKRLKEIDGRKQNTISKKLKACRDKNNCKDNNELYEKFRKMKEKSTELQ